MAPIWTGDEPCDPGDQLAGSDGIGGLALRRRSPLLYLVELEAHVNSLLNVRLSQMVPLQARAQNGLSSLP